MSDHESKAERAGIVDQQDAALEAMDDDDATQPASTDSTAEKAGIVDQQDAVLEAMERDEESS